MLVIKWRSRKLEKEKKQLEKIVCERTREIQEKNLQLRNQSEKLKEMDRIKSRFFANLSHEFRTPLTLIISPLEQMLERNPDKQQKKDLQIMLSNSHRLLMLINQLLELARFDSGKMKLQAVCANITSFIKEIIGFFEILARQNKLEIVLIKRKEDIILHFDPRRMEEVIYNLLINACKFTSPGGRITVSVSEVASFQERESNTSENMVEISVQDTGAGISKEEMEHIFDRFFLTENVNPKFPRGTGIGLALTKEIVELHHGSIDVHSQPGKGTEFVIRIPSGAKHLKPEEITTDAIISPDGAKWREITSLEAKTSDEYEEENMAGAEKDDVEFPKKPDKNMEKEVQKKQLILLVEDNENVRKFIRDPLENSKYNVLEAENGENGVRIAREVIPDLIVSDIMMPGMDGYELCRILKKDINTSHIPIILLTAKASAESIVKGFDTGADDYVAKPFNTRILLARIQNLIELRRQFQLKIQRQRMLLPMEIAISSADDLFLKEFQNLIEENISDSDLNIDFVCRKLSLGRTTLFRKLEALTNETPKEYIQSYRLERAARLLKGNFGNVTEVAMKVGFSNPQYFSQCFKEKYHMTPHSYKISQSE